MDKYADTPLGFWHLLGKCFEFYPIVLKNIWYLLVPVVVLTLMTTLLYPLDIYVATSVLILMSLAVFFFMAIALHIANKVLLGKPPGLNESVRNAIKRYLAILGGIALLILIMAITAVIDFAIIKVGESLGLVFIFYILAFCFTLFTGLLFYFAASLIVLETHSVLKSFEKSTKLFLVNIWRIIAVFLIIHLIVLLISSLGLIFWPSAGLSFFSMIYVVIVQFFTFPLIMSMILVLLHDANLRLGKIVPQR